MDTFSISAFALECKEAMRQSGDRQAAAEATLSGTLERFPAQEIIEQLEAAIPAGADIGEMIVHASPELTLLYARVPGRFQSGIHNHTVFACIGQLAGAETSVIYRREGDELRRDSTATVHAGQIMGLPADAIHHIENPLPTVSRSLHVYGGDFGALMDQRSLWSSEGHQEKPFSFPALLEESVSAMKREGNTTGLAELAKAIPGVRALLNA